LSEVSLGPGHSAKVAEQGADLLTIAYLACQLQSFLKANLRVGIITAMKGHKSQSGQQGTYLIDALKLSG
jgi:hypothetical protein